MLATPIKARAVGGASSEQISGLLASLDLQQPAEGHAQIGRRSGFRAAVGLQTPEVGRRAA
jgi:hypothetical protein